MVGESGDEKNQWCTFTPVHRVNCVKVLTLARHL
jgi:hypothetical protein